MGGIRIGLSLGWCLLQTWITQSDIVWVGMRLQLSKPANWILEPRTFPVLDIHSFLLSFYSFPCLIFWAESKLLSAPKKQKYHFVSMVDNELERLGWSCLPTFLCGCQSSFLGGLIVFSIVH